MASPPINIRRAIFLGVALLALAIRLPQLDRRPMHTDEAVNAYVTGQLLAGEPFHYDPRDRHGPALFALAEPLARMFGAAQFSDLTESELRLGPVLAGTATVLLLGAATEMFGFIPCLAAALLFAFAPLPLYYSRYFIHETLFVAATLGLILSGARALRSGSPVFAGLAGFCAALMVACKETALLQFLALALAALGAGLSLAHRPSTVRRPARLLAIAGAVFVLVAILLFTWGGRNWQALADLPRALRYLAARAGGEGHEKPFWYYVALLGRGWSGAAILGLAILGMLRAFVSPSTSRREGSAGPGLAPETSAQERPPYRLFLALYALLVAGFYSAIPYKTPWLALNFWLPFAVLAGMAAEWIWRKYMTLSFRVGFLICAVTLGIAAAHDTRRWVFADPAGETNPFAYAHTGEDLLRLPPRLEKLAQQRHLAQPLIAVVASDPWPLPWYLRKFSRVGYWQPGQDPGAADFFITSTDGLTALGERLKSYRPEYFGWRPNVLLMLWSREPARSSTHD